MLEAVNMIMVSTLTPIGPILDMPGTPLPTAIRLRTDTLAIPT